DRFVVCSVLRRVHVEVHALQPSSLWHIRLRSRSVRQYLLEHPSWASIPGFTAWARFQLARTGQSRRALRHFSLAVLRHSSQRRNSARHAGVHFGVGGNSHLSIRIPPCSYHLRLLAGHLLSALPPAAWI